jgi:hypothetical protein
VLGHALHDEDEVDFDARRSIAFEVEAGEVIDFGGNRVMPINCCFACVLF